MYAEFELQSIKFRFGFAVMRFYGTRIDRAFPDGTKRGEFKKLVRESLRTASGSEDMRAGLYNEVSATLPTEDRSMRTTLV
jgi:hypothetical protein